MKQRIVYRFEQLAATNTYKLFVYDDVCAQGNFNWETWQYEDSETSANYFRQQLDEIPETGEIELHINSCGGEVKEGIAIYNLLKQHAAHKTCYVDGFAYSIASVIAMACDHIIMGLGTSMLIHNMAMEVYGDAQTLRRCADDLDVLMESNRKIYLARAKGLTEEQLIDMMNAETFLTPEQCLEYGFCDEIAETYQADTKTALEQAQLQIRQLKQQLNSLAALRQEVIKAEPVQSAGADPRQANEPEPEKEPENNKALKMWSAFFDAFSK